MQMEVFRVLYLATIVGACKDKGENVLSPVGTHFGYTKDSLRLIDTLPLIHRMDFLSLFLVIRIRQPTNFFII